MMFAVLVWKMTGINAILRSPLKNINGNATILRNALVIVIPDFPNDSDHITISKSPGWSIQIPRATGELSLIDENGDFTGVRP